MGPDSNNKTKLQEEICIHIFTVSSAMVGVCLTVIGLIRVVITLGKADTWADDPWQVTHSYFSLRVFFPMRRCGHAVFAGCIELNARPTLFLSSPWC
jgi:hypothetical protein